MDETTTTDPQVTRTYPDGWTLKFGACGSVGADTLRVGFATSTRSDVEEIAAEAEAVTGRPMEVFADEDGDWCYRTALPAAKPLTIAASPADLLADVKAAASSVAYGNGVSLDHDHAQAVIDALVELDALRDLAAQMFGASNRR